jgi:uncharacterized membrane-anchored protein
MIRLLVFLLQIASLVIAFLFLRTTAGMTSFVWDSWKIEIHTSFVVLGILLLLFLAMWIVSLWFSWQRFFDRRKLLNQQKQSQRVLDLLLLTREHDLKGLNCQPLLKESLSLSEKHPYTALVQAEQTLKKGNLAAAEQEFLSLLSHKKTALPARVGLFNIAIEQQKPHDVFAWGQEILSSAPQAPFVHENLLRACQESPELSQIYAKKIATLLKPKTLAEHKNLRNLYSEWLMDQSRQKTLSANPAKKNQKEAIDLAAKAFKINPHHLSFERMVRSLVESKNPRHLKKASNLITSHWDSFASLTLARLYRDTIFCHIPPLQRLTELRKLVSAHQNQEEWVQATGDIILAETLIINGINGEALALLQSFQKKYPLQHQETLATLLEQLQDAQPKKKSKISPPDPLKIPPDVPLQIPQNKQHKKNTS